MADAYGYLRVFFVLESLESEITRFGGSCICGRCCPVICKGDTECAGDHHEMSVFTWSQSHLHKFIHLQVQEKVYSERG